MNSKSMTKGAEAQMVRDRRQFLKFLAASPYLAMLAGVPLITAHAAEKGLGQISNPKDALDVMDFEEVARHSMPVGHWAYLSSGTDDDATIKANREGFTHFQLRPRRLVDGTHVNTRTELFGTTYDSPIFCCPVGGHKTYHPEGELAVARAAKARGTMMILATPTTTPVEDVAQALGHPPWYQLYPPSTWPPLEQLLRRVEGAGCPVLVVTVDNATGRNMETYKRVRRLEPACNTCHKVEPGSDLATRPMFAGINMTGVQVPSATINWEWVDKLRKATKMKIVIKGLDTREDAHLCLEHGVDGILVSNHGGRATETGRATIDALSEVVAEVNNRIPVLVDSGFRRGTDVFKALALGARGVGIGRPYIWGLGAFGQPGVDRVLEILQGELKMIMANCGTQTLAEIKPEHVTRLKG